MNYEVLPSPDMLGAKILSGEAQMAIAPTNLGANLRARDVDIRYVGSMVWGMLYIVTREDIIGWEDLRGREIAMLGRGLTPDIVFRHLLTANGLDPESDITLSYVQASTELAPSFISGRSPISIMPEPALSMVITKVPDTKILLDLQREWAKVSNSSESYPQASLFVNGDTADNHTEFVTAFAAEYAASISRILADPAAAGRAASSFLDTPPAGVISKSIPRGNLEWIPAARARRSLEEYLGVLLDSAPKTVGGSLPGDGFYFITP